jgi:hypothetical protein
MTDKQRHESAWRADIFNAPYDTDRRVLAVWRNAALPVDVSNAGTNFFLLSLKRT